MKSPFFLLSLRGEWDDGDKREDDLESRFFFGVSPLDSSLSAFLD
jgi:hypothetical protein